MPRLHRTAHIKQMCPHQTDAKVGFRRTSLMGMCPIWALVFHFGKVTLVLRTSACFQAIILLNIMGESSMLRKVVGVEIGRGLEVERLSFLCDGVFAIVLTLLMFELKIPEGLAPDRILPALLANAPKFAAFVIAFNTGALGWAYSYLAHSIMQRSNFSHMFLTLISLMVVSATPFASALMGDYPASPWGYVPYVLGAGAFWAIMAIDMLVNGRALSDPALDKRLIITFYASTGFGAINSIVVCAIAFWNPGLMFGIIAAVCAIIWIEYYYLAAWIGRELARVQAGPNDSVNTQNL